MSGPQWRAVVGKRVQTCRWLSVGKFVWQMIQYSQSLIHNRTGRWFCTTSVWRQLLLVLKFYFPLLLVCLDVISWKNSTFWPCSHFIPSLCFVFGFIFRGLMPLSSLGGQLFPSPRALCPPALSALFCSQTRRLVVQSGWRGVILQIRPELKELLHHTALYVCSDWLPTYQHRMSFSPIITPTPFIFVHPPSCYLFDF